MSATSWDGWLSQDEVNRRASGRRRINAERKARAQKRREEIKEILGEGGILLCGRTFGRGKEAKLATYFGVHRSTICRDIAVLKEEYRKEHVCPTCRSLYFIPLKTLTKFAKQGVWDGCTTERCEKVDRIGNPRGTVPKRPGPAGESRSE